MIGFRTLSILTAVLSFAVTTAVALAETPTTAPSQTVSVTISGGHETDPRDHGRPVVLVAAGLAVPTEVFREAFTHVKPAPAGEQPDPEQVQRNKRALLNVLGKYGVTNDRLDEVSNKYRYPPGDRNLWQHTDAVAMATVVDGKVTGFVIQEHGAGYTSAPQASVAEFPDLVVKVTLHFGDDLANNGSVESITVLSSASTQP